MLPGVLNQASFLNVHNLKLEWNDENEEDRGRLVGQSELALILILG
jgi:hypothetical protein